MKKVDRWLLPDGIEEVLPEEASRVEGLRRRLVDLFQSCRGTTMLSLLWLNLSIPFSPVQVKMPT